MQQKKSRNAVKLFQNAGIKVERLTTTEELKTKNWIKPTKDRKGMIRLETKKNQVFQ